MLANFAAASNKELNWMPSTRIETDRKVKIVGTSVNASGTEALLLRDLEISEGWVSGLIKTPLSENAFSALVSFTFNVGGGALQRSTLRMKLNRGEVQGAADEFPKWKFANKRILAGLVRRRAAERALFLA